MTHPDRDPDASQPQQTPEGAWGWEPGSHERQARESDEGRGIAAEPAAISSETGGGSRPVHDRNQEGRHGDVGGKDGGQDVAGAGPGVRPGKPWMMMAGMGIELASYTLGLAGIGYLVDLRRGHTTPYATAAGALVGFSYGMFRFIQKASQTH